IVLQNFTNNASELEQAIRKTSPGGSTSMYNAVYIALKDLKKIVAKNVDEIRRQAIVLLSDGEDTSSLLPFEEVPDLAKRSETGGRAFFANQASELTGIYGQISDELSSQYTVGYTSKNQKRDGGWRRVVVRVNRQSTTARTKQGYFAPTSH